MTGLTLTAANPVGWVNNWKSFSLPFHEWIINSILPSGVSQEQPSGDDVPGPNGDRLRAESAQVEGGVWHRNSGEKDEVASCEKL